MKNPAIACWVCASVWLSTVGGYAPPTTPPAAPAAVTTPTPTVFANPTTAQPDSKKPVPNYGLIVNCAVVDPSRVGDNLQVSVIVVSRTGQFPANAQGILEVFDADGRILTCVLPAEKGGKGLLYEFNLSPKYTEKTRFSFKATSSDSNGNPTSDTVVIHIKDFIH